jgi:Spy/CpxP family protein refolding chaperone
MKSSLLKSAIFAGMIFGTSVYAQPGPHCNGDGAGPGTGESPDCRQHEQMMKKFDEELNLTPEQNTRLQALREEGKAARKQHMQKMKDVRQKMKDELSKEKPDGTKLMELASQTADLVEQQTRAQMDHLLKVKQILNKEQFEKMLSREGGQRGERRNEDCRKKDECQRHKK